jgi:hypothetical protein
MAFEFKHLSSSLFFARAISSLPRFAGVRFNTDIQVRGFLRDLAAEVTSRMHQAGVRGTLITLKLMRTKGLHLLPFKHLGHGPCTSHSASRRLMREVPSAAAAVSLRRADASSSSSGGMSGGTVPRHDTTGSAEIFDVAWALCAQMKVPANEIRGLGISVGALVRVAERASGGASGLHEYGSRSRSLADMFAAASAAAPQSSSSSASSSSAASTAQSKLGFASTGGNVNSKMARLVFSPLLDITELLPARILMGVAMIGDEAAAERAEMLPPPPRLPSSASTSSSSSSLSASTSASSRVPRPPSPRAAVPLIPLSQIDEATMRELPEPVRLQLRSDYVRAASAHALTASSSVSSSSSSVSRHAGQSTLSPASHSAVQRSGSGSIGAKVGGVNRTRAEASAAAASAASTAQRKLAFSSDAANGPAAKRQRSDAKRAVVISLLDDAENGGEEEDVDAPSESGDRILDASTRLAKENELRVFVREDPDVILVWSSIFLLMTA